MNLCKKKLNNFIRLSKAMGALTLFNTYVTSYATPKCATILFLGDLFVREDRYHEELFNNIKDYTKKANLTIANLEGPLTNLTEIMFPNKTFALKSTPKLAPDLYANNIKGVTLANNHFLDFKQLAADNTLDLLKKNNILHTGYGTDLKSSIEPIRVEINGVKISVFAFSFTYPLESWATEKTAGVAPGHINLITETIANEKEITDFIVTSFHWGEENSFNLRDYQKEVAMRAINAGAHLIIGHHPHILQKLEFYNNSLIAYSLGNFIFTSVTNRIPLSAGIYAKFCNNNTTNYALLPLNTAGTFEGFKVTPYTKEEFKIVLEEYPKNTIPTKIKIMFKENNEEQSIIAENKTE